MLLPSFSEFVAMVDRLAPLLLDTAARGVVVLGLSGLAALAMRRASAAARHWVWLLGFAGLLLLPVLSATLPGWHVLPRLDRNRAELLASQAGTPSSLPAPALESAMAVSNESPSTGQKISLPAQTATMQPAPQMQADHQVAPAQNSPRAPLPWTFWPVIVWLGGSAMILVYVLLGHASLWLLQSRCARISRGELPELLGELRQLLGVRRKVQLLSSPQRAMPMTWGVWRTRLLLPQQAANWPLQQQRFVLLHELGHVRRHDCFTQFLGQLGCALYWFNPIVWFAWQRMQVERERACDDLVLNTGAKASAYANDLLNSASTMLASRFVGAAVAMARPSTLEERLVMILDPRRNRRALTIKSALATILLLVAALVPVAVLRAQEVPASATRPRIGVSAATAPTTFPAQGVSSQRGGGGRGGIGRGIGPGPRGPVPMTLGEGPTCTLDATIYEVILPPDQLGRLDLNGLARYAADPAVFEKALAGLGATKPLYRANQSVRLAGDSINMGSTKPYVTATSLNRSGQTVNTVGYSNVGAQFSLVGKPGAGTSIELDLNLQISSLSDSKLEISGDIKAPLYRTAMMTHKGKVEADKPFVVVSADAANLDTNGKAVAYVARMTLGAPEPAGAPGRGE